MIDLKIQELISERDTKIKELEHITDEQDMLFLLSNWKKMVHFEEKFHPDMFKHIVVSCFPLYTTKCCCMKYSKDFIYLSDLLMLWNTGFMYDDKPVVDICVGNGDKVIIKTIDGATIKSNCVIYDEAKKIIEMIKAVPTSKHFSKTSVSDIKIKTLI